MRFVELGPLVAPERLSLLFPLSSAVEKPYARVREALFWKGEIAALSEVGKIEFETVCPSD